MKKIAISLCFLILIAFSCNDDIGNLDFEKKQIRTYSKFIPEIGTFNFEQDFEVSTNNSLINTRLKLKSEYSNINTINFEVINFKNSNWSYNTIDFNQFTTIEANNNLLSNLSNSGSTFLNDANTSISIYQLNPQDSLSGHYNGIGKLLIEDETDGSQNIEEIFNVFASFNHLNQVLILSKEENSSFKHIKGTYLLTGEFNGTIHKDSVIGELDNTNSSPFTYTASTFADTLNVTVNNVEKKLAITLHKN